VAHGEGPVVGVGVEGGARDAAALQSNSVLLASIAEMAHQGHAWLYIFFHTELQPHEFTFMLAEKLPEENGVGLLAGASEGVSRFGQWL
jgi:hypothetical protein